MGTFIRNHDELDLERLSDDERNEVYAAFAPSEDMRIYGRGIRRRLAPMLNGERRRLELVYSLLFSLPGTPVMRYGDELGMGEDLSLPERNSVRTTMQWSREMNGGFSVSENAKLHLPIIKDGDFGYHKINVYDQMRNPQSLLNWFERIISARKECIEFGWGNYELIETNNPAVLAHSCQWKNGYAMAIHNFSDSDLTIELNLKKEQAEHLIEYFADKQYEDYTLEKNELHIGPYGYRWFRRSSLFL
jgi:maltose alpha-D-glucosyltransferase/alpha-amylase